MPEAVDTGARPQARGAQEAHDSVQELHRDGKLDRAGAPQRQPLGQLVEVEQLLLAEAKRVRHDDVDVECLVRRQACAGARAAGPLRPALQLAQHRGCREDPLRLAPPPTSARVLPRVGVHNRVRGGVQHGAVDEERAGLRGEASLLEEGQQHLGEHD